jgi:uncharacterized protein (TIGR02996 family)
MSVLGSILQAVVDDPLSEGRWSVLADWLEEYEDPERAELLRLHRRLIATCCEPDAHPERAGWQVRIVELLGQGVRPCVPQQTVELAEGVEMAFSFVPPGEFLMGSPAGEQHRDASEGPQHPVTLTRGFWLGVNPVTQAQWQAVTGRNPTRFKGSQVLKGSDPFQDQDRPAENVSWDHCQEFCLGLAERAGGWFRLPREAEWEHACRSGTTTPFFFGETLSTDLANYNGEEVYGRGLKGRRRGWLTPVGLFPPNAWGLFDLHGNVDEWCLDWYCEGYYGRSPGRDPEGPAAGVYRVLRGGCWYKHPFACRSAHRSRARPDDYQHSGCRVVLCPGVFVGQVARYWPRPGVVSIDLRGGQPLRVGDRVGFLLSSGLREEDVTSLQVGGRPVAEAVSGQRAGHKTTLGEGVARPGTRVFRFEG